MLFTQTCCRNAVRDARLTVHLTQLQVFLVLQFGPPSVSDVLLVSLNSLNPISSARSFKMPAANRECPSSAQCKPPRHHSHFGHSGLAFAFQFIRYVSCSAHLTTSRLISFANYHKAPRSYWSSLSCCFGVVSISLQLIQFRPPPRLFFPARKSQQMANGNCHFFRDVLFSSRIQCIQRPLPPFLAKNERPRDGPTSLKLLSSYFWLWASPSFLPPFLPFISFIPRPPQARQAGRSPRSFVLFLNSFPPN